MPDRKQRAIGKAMTELAKLRERSHPAHIRSLDHQGDSALHSVEVMWSAWRIMRELIQALNNDARSLMNDDVEDELELCKDEIKDSLIPGYMWIEDLHANGELKDDHA